MPAYLKKLGYESKETQPASHKQRRQESNEQEIPRARRGGRMIAEYALRDIRKPIGVAEWQTQLVHLLPEPLRSNLPTIEQIEEELGGAK